MSEDVAGLVAQLRDQCVTDCGRRGMRCSRCLAADTLERLSRENAELRVRLFRENAELRLALEEAADDLTEAADERRRGPDGSIHIRELLRASHSDAEQPAASEPRESNREHFARLGSVIDALDMAPDTPQPALHPDLFRCYCGAVLRRSFYTVDGETHICPLNAASEPREELVQAALASQAALRDETPEQAAERHERVAAGMLAADEQPAPAAGGSEAPSGTTWGDVRSGLRAELMAEGMDGLAADRLARKVVRRFGVTPGPYSGADHIADTTLAATPPDTAQPATRKPCCEKCGSHEVATRFIREGQRGVGEYRFDENSPRWQNIPTGLRNDYGQLLAMKDVLLRRCRTCGWWWTTDAPTTYNRGAAP